MEKINVTCQTKDHLEIGLIDEFQKDLKSLSTEDFAKLKKSILRYGLSFPSFIWQTKDANKCLDGHQRMRVLSEMKKDGYEIPPIPVVYVDATDEKEAKEKILLLSSQYGRYTMDSVYAFIEQSQIVFNDLKDVLDLPQFDLGKFEDFYYNDDAQASSADQPRLDQRAPIECPNCGKSFIPE